MLADQKDRIQLTSHAAALMIAAAIKDVQDPEQKKTITRNLVNDIIYESDRSGYLFVYEGTVNVAFPVKTEAVGKDLGALTDKNGVRVIAELRDAAMAGGGFVNYVWPKPGAGEQPKRSYAERIPGTDMWVGTGVYVDNIQAYKSQMAEEIGSKVSSPTVSMVLISGAIFVAIIGLCLYIAFGIVNALKEMITSFQDIAENSVNVGHSSSELARQTSAATMEIKQKIDHIQSSTDGTEEGINEISIVNQRSGEIATRGDQVKISADDLKRMAAELNTIVGSFKV